MVLGPIREGHRRSTSRIPAMLGHRNEKHAAPLHLSPPPLFNGGDGRVCRGGERERRTMELHTQRCERGARTRAHLRSSRHVVREKKQPQRATRPSRYGLGGCPHGWLVGRVLPARMSTGERFGGSNQRRRCSLLAQMASVRGDPICREPVLQRAMDRNKVRDCACEWI